MKKMLLKKLLKKRNKYEKKVRKLSIYCQKLAETIEQIERAKLDQFRSDFHEDS